MKSLGARIYLLCLSTFLAVSCGTAEAPDIPRNPNILIFLIDTLRADRLGTYGYPLPTSPNLDRFSRESLVYESCQAASPNTAPSHASLFTSTYPATHQIWNEVNLDSERSIFPVLPENAVTLAEVLVDSGYRTAAIADGGFVSRARGFDQGYHHFESRFRGVRDRMRNALKWLKEDRAGSPFFLFLHTYETHSPYLPEAPYLNRFAKKGYKGPLYRAWKDASEFSRSHSLNRSVATIHQRFFAEVLPWNGPKLKVIRERAFLRALYDAEIAQVDDEFGHLMSFLESSDLLDETIVVVTSDHGEEFWDHDGYGHDQVCECNLRVPLFIRRPNNPHGDIRSEIVELIDLMPTLLAEASTPVPESVAGRRLNLERASSSERNVRFFFSENNKPKRQVAIRSGNRKAVFYPDSDRPPSFFLLNSDPGEKVDLAVDVSSSRFLTEAETQLLSWRRASEQHRDDHKLHPEIKDKDQIGEDTLEEIRALGYLTNGGND